MPVEVRWQPQRTGRRLTPAVATAINGALRADSGDVLVFLPGVGEIRAVAGALGTVSEVEILPLHGACPPPSRTGPSGRAGTGTSCWPPTWPNRASRLPAWGSWWTRAWPGARLRPGGGPTRLRTVVARRASADQRAGRAGRTAAGIAYRLWAKEQHGARRAWSDPEIATVDLAALALELAVWGAAEGALRWVTPTAGRRPFHGQAAPRGAGRPEQGRPTDLGRRLVELPLHPRLARMLLEAPGAGRSTRRCWPRWYPSRDIFRPDAGSGPQTAQPRRAGWLSSSAVRPPGRPGRPGCPFHRPAARGESTRRVSRRRARGGEAAQGRAGRAPLPQPPRPPSPRSRPGPGVPAGRGLPRSHRPTGSGRGQYRLRHGAGALLPEHDPLQAADWLVVAEVEGPAGTSGRGRRPDPSRRRAGAVRGRTDRRPGRHHGRDARVGRPARRPPESYPEAARLPRSRLAAAVQPSPGPQRPRPWWPRPCGKDWPACAGHPRPGPSRPAPGGLAGPCGADWPALSDPALAARAEEWLVPLLGGATGRAGLARVDPALPMQPPWGDGWLSWIVCCLRPQTAGWAKRPDRLPRRRPSSGGPRPGPVRHHRAPVGGGRPGADHPRAALSGGPAHPDHGRPSRILDRTWRQVRQWLPAYPNPWPEDSRRTAAPPARRRGRLAPAEKRPEQERDVRLADFAHASLGLQKATKSLASSPTAPARSQAPRVHRSLHAFGLRSGWMEAGACSGVVEPPRQWPPGLIPRVPGPPSCYQQTVEQLSR